jgi:putative ABC transport system permease protein
VLKLAFRNVFRQKLRTALTLAAIISGVVALVLSGGFIEDSLIRLRESTIRSQLGHVQIYKAGFYAHGAQAPYRYMIDKPAEVLGIVQMIPEVKQAAQRLSFTALLNNGHADVPVLCFGLEPEKERLSDSTTTITAGRELRDSDRYGILLGESVAAASKLKPGDHAALLTNTAEGALNTIDMDVIGVFRSFSKDYDARAVRILLPSAQELLDVKAINAIVLSLDATGSTNAVAAYLKKRLDNSAYEVKTWYQLADFYGKTAALYKRQFVVLQAVVLIAILLGVISSVNMTIFERTREFGTMMALGDRGGKILRLVVVENVLLGLIGGVGGALLGVALAWGVSLLGIPMPPPPNSSVGYVAEIRVTPSIVALSSLVGFVATVAASVWPALRIVRLPIVDALGENH